MEHNDIDDRIIVNVQYVHVHEVPDPVLAILSEKLGPDRVYQDAAQQKRHLLGKWLALSLLAGENKHAGVHAFRFSEYGKPYIPAAQSFNISHSGNLVICASTARGEIGIDLEQQRSIDWLQYEDSFAPSEWQLIVSAPDPCLRLLELWTKKESLLKADGRGFQVPLPAVTVSTHYGVIGDGKQWYFTPVVLAGYVCHICTEFRVEKVILEKTGSLPTGHA